LEKEIGVRELYPDPSSDESFKILNGWLNQCIGEGSFLADMQCVVHPRPAQVHTSVGMGRGPGRIREIFRCPREPLTSAHQMAVNSPFLQFIEIAPKTVIRGLH